MKWWLGVLLLCVGCESGTAPEPQRTLEILGGDNQSGGMGAALSQPVRVRVLVNGQPARGVEVRWRAIEGGGSVSDLVTVTDAEGVAEVLWTLGGDSGPQLLLAAAGNSYRTIRATSRIEFGFVSVGRQHACALTTMGEAFCWGNNAQGQLGNGTQTSTEMPVRVYGPARFKRITAGWSHTCGVGRAGDVWCWGDNTVGQLGVAPSITGSAIPLNLTAGDNFIDVSAGFIHTCGVTTAGVARCWGANTQQQYGAQPATNLRQISAGEFHTCGVRNDTTAVCWGWNSAGELGANLPLGVMTPTPHQTWQGQRFVSVTAGIRHSCALDVAGQVYCWGRNAAGETGQDPFINIAVPAPVAGAGNFSAVTTGNTHSCGLSARRAYCWGTPLGNGTTLSSKAPVLVSAVLQFTMISAGFDQTCGIASGEVWCWGVRQLAPVRVLSP